MQHPLCSSEKKNPFTFIQMKILFFLKNFILKKFGMQYIFVFLKFYLVLKFICYPFKNIISFLYKMINRIALALSYLTIWLNSRLEPFAFDMY